MIARYAPPVSYNFLNLIRLGSDKTTIFEQVIILPWFHAFAFYINVSMLMLLHIGEKYRFRVNK
jgi:hypothetical protein